MAEYSLRAVAFKEGQWWVAQCLEYNFATQAARLEDLPHELLRCLAVQITASREAGVESFTGYSPAPRRYWEMYESARSRVLPIESGETALGLPSDLHLRAEVETRIAA